MAKRLSDEADAEFRASGKASSVSARTRRRSQEPDTNAEPPSAANPTASTATQPAPGASEPSSSSSTSSTSDASSSSSSSSARSSSVRSSLLRSLTNEWAHLQDYLKKWQRAPSISRTKRTAAEVLTKPAIAPKPKQPYGSAPSQDEAAVPEDPTAAEPATASPSSELVLVDSSTVWDRRLERMRASFATSAPFLRFHKARRTLIHSQNPVLRPIQSVASSISEAVEDVKLTWETSQHPLLFKVRDVTDRVIGETEMGFALGEIQKVDPSFDLLSFQREMEEYQIPVVITAYLRGSPSDQRLLAQCSEGPAATLMRASFHERLAQGEEWDSRILDISNVELQKAIMLKDMPVLLVAFMVQQVNCVRKVKGLPPSAKPTATAATASKAADDGGKKAKDGAKDGPAAEKRFDSEGREIVSGFESDITHMYYHWVLRRDFENPDFDWRLMEMSSMRVASLGV